MIPTTLLAAVLSAHTAIVPVQHAPCVNAEGLLFSCALPYGEQQPPVYYVVPRERRFPDTRWRSERVEHGRQRHHNESQSGQ